MLESLVVVNCAGLGIGLMGRSVGSGCWNRSIRSDRRMSTGKTELNWQENGSGMIWSRVIFPMVVKCVCVWRELSGLDVEC